MHMLRAAQQSVDDSYLQPASFVFAIESKTRQRESERLRDAYR